MIAFLVICGVLIAAVFCWAWVKFVYWLIPRKHTDNLYIQSHLARRKNDKDYDEYLKWMEKTGGSLPIDKIKTVEEARFEREIKKIL